MSLTAEESRKVSLIEVLAEDHEEVPEPPEYAIQKWSEEQIRQYFANGGDMKGLPGEQTNGTAPPSAEDLKVLKSKYPPSNVALFEKWFPGLKRSKTAQEAPNLRLLCFPNAGSAEDMYTNAGVGARKESTLIDWCVKNKVEILAVQPPGRAMRVKEPLLYSCQEMARILLPIVASKLLDGVPYCIIGHSVGSWNAFEFLSLAREEGFPMPKHAFFSCFPGPDIPSAERPWRANASLSEGEFKDEARGWDVNEMVFTQLWETYQPIMRADFSLFDQYDYQREGEPPFSFPMTTYFATRDRRITSSMVEGWQAFTDGAFELVQVEGHHLYPLGLDEQKPAKTFWLSHVVARLDPLLV
mmetsp:Transcript_11428/g.70176  ORF Transcript_11428/g.70176 Transcript_11428/m.70176 type:complete len:356 (-) Transcript_11428:19-1086(-)